MTNDLNSYRGVSLSADRGSLVTVRNDVCFGVWVGDGEATHGSEAVSQERWSSSAIPSLAWAGDNLLYTTGASGRFSIARVIPGRGTPEEIVAKGQAPAATSDGRTIVFAQQGDGLWKVDADGRHGVQLVSRNASNPLVTPDDRHVVFLSSEGGVQSSWIVPIDGGSPAELTKVFMGGQGVDVSPDGMSIVFKSRDEQNQSELVVCDMPACASRRRVTAPASAGRVRWTPDGRAIAVIDAASQSNIWIQPLDKLPPHQLTHFRDRTIGDFAWSRDGNRLAVARVTVANDIVLFKGLRR